MLLELNHKWDVDVSTYCCSENVEIIFSALHNAIYDFADKALTWQGHNVIFMQWLNLLISAAITILKKLFIEYCIKVFFKLKIIFFKKRIHKFKKHFPYMLEFNIISINN